MAVNLFEKITDDSELNTKYLKFIVSQQTRAIDVVLGEDIIHIIAIYSITYNWHGRFKWLSASGAYTRFPLPTDSVISIKSIDFQEIYIVHCSTANSPCYNYDPFKDKFYAFQSQKPTYSKRSDCTLISDGRVVSIGGMTKHIDLYDPRTGTWIKHNFNQNIIDFGASCVVVQDQSNPYLIHCVGGDHIVCNALHSLDTRNGFKCAERTQVNIRRGDSTLTLKNLTGHAVLMSDTNQMLLFGGRKLNEIYKLNLSANRMDLDNPRVKTAEWVGPLDRALFGYDVTPDRKYAVIAGGMEYASFTRRKTISVLDMANVDQNIQPLHFMANMRLALPSKMSCVGITTLDDTIHVFGGFNGHTGTNTHWVARTRDIVIGSEY
eukprot:138787_1